MMSDGGRSTTFELADPRHALRAVRLVQEVGLPEPLDFAASGTVWRLQVPCPDVDRMEYLFELEDRRGRRFTVLDPGNARRVGGAFGDKSVREFPGYRPPAWLEADTAPGHERLLTVAASELHADIELTLWSPTGLPRDEPAPLVVVHDGPEFARLGGVTQFLAAVVGTGEMPPVRAALLDPGDRNAWYAADRRYADALCGDVMSALDEHAATTGRIGVGASLGALAMLHAHRRHPGTFAALLLQSGSFFTPEHDSQERDFSGWEPITDFVAGVAAADGQHETPVPTVLTCGTVEENLANNRARAGQLRRLGYPVELHVVRDAHNYTAWRDALAPSLTQLVVAAADGSRAA